MCCSFLTFLSVSMTAAALLIGLIIVTVAVFAVGVVGVGGCCNSLELEEKDNSITNGSCLSRIHASFSYMLQ